MIVSSYHFLVGPLVAFAALGVILLLCRWVFSAPAPKPAATTAPATAPSPAPGDYGLLVPVASVRTGDDAEMLRLLLQGAGIRCTVTSDGTEAAQVLVFRADAGRARELVSS